MGFWRSYMRLAPQTRMMYGVGVMIWGVLGLMWTNSIEEENPAPKAHRKELERIMPRFTMLDRGSSLPEEIQAEARMKARLKEISERRV